jgi:tRNA(Ile2) C34 agmatinyltransferase TiaS
MPHTMLPTTEDIISDILNWVCPECGGPMGGRTKEFKCQGECRTDWRDVWKRSLSATTPQHLRPANSNGSEIQDDARIQKRLTTFVKG